MFCAPDEKEEPSEGGGRASVAPRRTFVFTGRGPPGRSVAGLKAGNDLKLPGGPLISVEHSGGRVRTNPSFSCTL